MHITATVIHPSAATDDRFTQSLLLVIKSKTIKSNGDAKLLMIDIQNNMLPPYL